MSAGYTIHIYQSSVLNFFLLNTVELHYVDRTNDFT
jgi:hypothetical protein